MAKSPLTKEQWDKQGLRVPSAPQTPEEKVALVESLPATVKQIHVCDLKGYSVWRKPDKIKVTDIIVFRKSNGLPNLRVAKVGVDDADNEVQDKIRRREDHTTEADIVRVARHSMDPSEVNRQALIRMAEVSSAMEFERLEAERAGKSIDKILMREMRALKTLSDAAAKQVDQRLKRQEIDLGSLAFKNIASKMIQTFYNAMLKSGVSQEEAKQVVTDMASTLDSPEWQSSMTKSISGD